MKKTHRYKLDTTPTQWKTAPWAMAHSDAACCPRPGFETALHEMISGWLRYAASHAHAYESEIGGDGVLCDHWAQIGTSLRGLLNGCRGRFDGGLLDALLVDTLREQEFDPDTL